MKKILIGGLVVILLGGGGIVGYYLLSGNNQEDASTITIATFNIQNLGRDKAYQVPNVVKIIEQFDLGADQEEMNYMIQGEREQLQCKQSSILWERIGHL